MNNDLNFYLPNLDDNSTQKYTFLMKDKFDTSFDSSVVSNKFYSLEDIIAHYQSLKADNNDDDFYIITEQTARSVANKDKIASNDWVKIINETYAKLGLTSENLNNEQLIEKRQKDKLEKAKALGLVSEEPVVAPVAIEQYLPKVEDDSTQYCFIIKDKNNNNLQQVSIDQDIGNLAMMKKIVSSLNNNVNDKEYYIVTPQFAADLQNLNNNDIGNVINKTQELVGNPLRLNIEQPEVKLEKQATTKEKLANPGINEILAPDAPDEKVKTAPTPEEVNNNYQPLSQQFTYMRQKHLEAKMKKSPVSKAMVFTTVGLVGAGVLSISLSPIALPAAFVIGSAALIKSALFKGDKTEMKQWEKRKQLLTEAAIDSVGGKFLGRKKKPTEDEMRVIENIIFTPEIEKKYQELCKKASLAPSVSDKIANIRNGGNTPTYPKKNHGIK